MDVSKSVSWISVLFALTFLVSCKKDGDNGGNVTQLRFEVPSNFPSAVYQFTDNEVSNQRFQLGRKLFYDPVLSRDSTISCGSCHIQSGAFSHIDHKVSHGIDGLTGIRNSPVIFNMAWQTNFFWDGGVNHLELQPINPIQNPVEMDETMANVISKLRMSEEYKNMFLNAYGSDSITSQLMLRAMAQFMAMMVSANSKYDKYMRGEPGGTFTAQELNGLNIYRQKCASCHTEPLFTDLTYRNNGLDSVFTDDPGRALITGLPDDEGKFKVPSLRNTEVSFPYMHHGKIKTLQNVLDHYSSGIKNSATLDPLLQGGIPLTSQEKIELNSFLETLTDYTFLTDSKFSEIH
jgi:cytochrome c peroxidase